MATAEDLKAQLTKVRQEMAKLLELLESIETPAAPAAKKTRART